MKKFFYLALSLVTIGASLTTPSTIVAHDIHKDPIADSYNNQMISDVIFRNKETMTRDQIQTFLVLKGSALASYQITFDTYIGPGDTINANGWYAADVISMSAGWYNINPQVILATLQKESSLITSGNLSYINEAMGYGCPEGAGCSGSFANFARQVDGGTYQLDFNFRGSEAADTGRVQSMYKGNTVTIDGKATYLQNSATASLYRYTPHRPDSAYLTATNGSHYYGNYNLIANFIGYFGTTGGEYIYTNVYRFWNNNGTHFYTASESEKNNVIARWPNIYRLEGVAYRMNASDSRNTVPLYRFYNTSNGTHFYTASDIERDDILRKWGYKFRLDGVAYFVAGQGTPVYRFWNTNGTHFYTASEIEKADVIRMYPDKFKFEGIAYYIN